MSDNVGHQAVGQRRRKFCLRHLSGIELLGLLMDVGDGERGEVMREHFAERGHILHALPPFFHRHGGVGEDARDGILLVTPHVEVAEHVLVSTELCHQIISVGAHQVAQGSEATT